MVRWETRLQAIDRLLEVARPNQEAAPVGRAFSASAGQAPGLERPLYMRSTWGCVSVVVARRTVNVTSIARLKRTTAEN